MPQSIRTHTFPNGLTLVGESMQWLESVAFALLVPAGCQYDAADKIGTANFTSEMVQRGCGTRSSREFVEDLENLGVEKSASVSNVHSSFGGAMPADKLSEALPIFADLVLRPLLPDDQIEDGRLVCFQEVRALEDDLAQQTLQRLRERFYGPELGRMATGTMESIQAITLADIQQHFANTYRPNGAILSVAGNFDWDQLRAEVEGLFGDWTAQKQQPTSVSPAERDYFHIPHESSQTHIAIAFPNVPYPHPDYFQARGAVGVLSDGMSSRLFTEVREKRGLCYTVFASCHSLIDRGSVLCYAGTTTDRAQETLNVILDELHRLVRGIEPAELDRLKARIKSALIMQQESSSSRAGSIAADWYYLSRVRTLDELGAIIDGLTCDSINKYLADNPPGDFTIVTLGERKLEIPVGVS